MRIVVNDIAASRTGALSILKDLYRYIRDHETEHEWIFLLSDAYLEETERIRVIVVDGVKKSWFHRLFFDFFSAKKLIGSLKPDLFFSLQNTLPLSLKGPKALYIHQPLGFQTAKRFSFLKGAEREYAIYQHLIAKLINASARKADCVIVQTDWMREAVIKKARVRPERVKKIPPALPDMTGFARADYGTCREFFYPSGDMLYKNHALLYEAAALLLEKGETDFGITITLTKEEFLDKLSGTHVKEEVLTHFTCLGRISREETYALYAKSILVFPSYIETFGYPPAEARSLGALVLASACPFCEEVLKGYANAYAFDPFDAGQLSELMADVIEGKIRRREDREDRAASDDGWGEVVDAVCACGPKQ